MSYSLVRITGYTGATGCTGTFGPTGMTGCTGTFSGVIYQSVVPYTPNNVSLGDPNNYFNQLYVSNVSLAITDVLFSAPTNNTFNISANTVITSTSVSTSTATGALQVTGGAGIGGNLYLGNTTYNNNNITLSGAKAPSGTASGVIGIAYGNGTWSTSSVSGDMVICTSNNLIMQSGNGAAGIFVNSSNNYVGIGTTNPGYLLDVSGAIGTITGFMTHNSSTALFLCNRSVAASVGTSFALYQGSGGDTVLNAASGQTIQYKINNTEYMRISSTGNVGIGTTNPTSLLHVNGQIKFGASTSINSSITIPTSGSNNQIGNGSSFTKFYVTAYSAGGGATWFELTGLTMTNSMIVDITTVYSTGGTWLRGVVYKSGTTYSFAYPGFSGSSNTSGITLSGGNPVRINLPNITATIYVEVMYI